MVTRRAESARVGGPLAGCAAGFVAELRGRGYTELSTWRHVRLLDRLSAWLEQAGVEPAALSGEEVTRFLAARRRASPTGLRTERALAPLLDHLRPSSRRSSPLPTRPPGGADATVPSCCWRPRRACASRS